MLMFDQYGDEKEVALLRDTKLRSIHLFTAVLSIKKGSCIHIQPPMCIQTAIYFTSLITELVLF